MIYLNVLGQHFVILSSLEVISDLFEKRSTIYSDRKQTTMLTELYVSHSFRRKEYVKNANRCRMNWRISLALMPYGRWWRRHRRLFHEHFHPNAVKKYYPIQRQEVQAFLRRLLVSPDDFFHHVRQ
jgi:cytochrome P450